MKKILLSVIFSFSIFSGLSVTGIAMDTADEVGVFAFIAEDEVSTTADEVGV